MATRFSNRLMRRSIIQVCNRGSLSGARSFHTKGPNYEKEPIVESERQQDRTERTEELKGTTMEATDARTVQEAPLSRMSATSQSTVSNMSTVTNSENDSVDALLDDFMENVLSDVTDAQETLETSGTSVSPSEEKTSPKRGSHSKRFNQDSFQSLTRNESTSRFSPQMISEKIKIHPRYDWRHLRVNDEESEDDVLRRVVGEFETLKRLHSEKRQAFHIAKQEALSEKKKLRRRAPVESGWEDVAITNILENRMKKRPNPSKLLSVQDVLVKNPITNEDEASASVISKLDTRMIPRINSSLNQEYPAVPYLHKKAFEDLKARLDMHTKSEEPLPEDLIPFKKILEARGEKLLQLQNEQYIGKLVPLNTKPLHLWEDISSTKIGAHRAQWKKKRFLLRKALRARERSLAKLSSRKPEEFTLASRVEDLPLRWRALYTMLMNRLKAAVRPDGNWTEARDIYRLIRSTFYEKLDLEANREHLEVYFLGHAKYWDWNKARAIFMKNYKTIWNLHPSTRDETLLPIHTLVRGLAYRQRSFEELLALHQLIADEAANGLLFKRPIPPKSYYDNILALLIEEKNWNLARAWFLRFYQTTWDREPSPHAHIIPDAHSYELILEGARLMKSGSFLEAHLILHSARRDQLSWVGSFDLTPTMMEHVLQSHIQDGDGAGASRAFKLAFATPFSSGTIVMSDLPLDRQKELYHLYFKSLGLSKDLNETYKSLTALYHADPTLMEDVEFHNRILASLWKLNASLGVHFLKTIFKVNGHMHHNPVHPNFYTFEIGMSRAIQRRRFLFARGIYNLAPPTIRGAARQKLRNMRGIALRPAWSRTVVDAL